MSALRIVLIIALAVPSCAAACDADLTRDYTPIAERMDRGMLYVVDNCEQPASYVFGTVHLDNKEILNAAAPAFAALKTSSRAAFELEAGEATQRKVIGYMVLPPEEKRTLSQIVGSTTFERLMEAIAVVQSGYPRPLLERYRPWAASVMVQLPTSSYDGVPLDDRLQKAARLAGIPTFGLETVEEQMAAFNGLTEQEQVKLLHDTLENIADIRKMNTKLQRLYILGDLRGIERLGETAFSEINDTKMRLHLRNALITRRNDSLTNAMLPHLHTGRSFVAIGALHLPGEDGVLNQLEAKGYYIWPTAAVTEASHTNPISSQHP